MSLKDWKYYNHAVIPAVEPHEEPDLSCIKDKSIWKVGGGIPFLARWTTDYDCGYETSWWYCIKDDSFDIKNLSSNYRYKINKGKKLFDVREIRPEQYGEEIYQVYSEAYASWPEKYRPTFSIEDAKVLVNKLSKQSNMICYGAFYKENQELCCIMLAPLFSHHVELQVQRVKPKYEKYQINAALVEHLLTEYEIKFKKSNFYVLDGERSIRHETAFQDYLEKYFGFRKVYCTLNILYRFPLNIMVKILFPFRKKINSESKIGSLLCAILRMEEFRRQCE